jgi:hypothetical protein
MLKRMISTLGLVTIAGSASAEVQSNGLHVNALTSNVLTQNALTANVLTQNALIGNVLTQNALVENGVEYNGASVTPPGRNGLRVISVELTKEK